MHIQNNSQNGPPDEKDAFTKVALRKAEKLAVKFFKHMQKTYPRPDNIPSFEITFPWQVEPDKSNGNS